MSKADNKELEEAIKVLQKLKIEIDNIFYALHTSNPKKGNAIGVVLKELERLQEENNKLERANKTYINSIQSIAPVLLEDYIEKDKIREKIEERKFKLQQEYRNFEDDIELNILKELLEGK